MENQFVEKKKYRVIRQYHDNEKRLSFDLYMNMTEDIKRITAIRTRTIAEGVNTSEFVVFVENEKLSKCTIEYWKGQKDVVTGLMTSKRQFLRQVDYEVGHLFVSECTTNCFAIKNNSEAVAQVAERVLEFARMEYNKAQKPL